MCAPLPVCVVGHAQWTLLMFEGLLEVKVRGVEEDLIPLHSCFIFLSMPIVTTPSALETSYLRKDVSR